MGNSSDKMKASLQQQPVAVAIAANNVYIHSYASGVIDAKDCNKGRYGNINHAVLIVGYGNDEATGLDYWLIKNSWNTTWGDKGYVKFAISAKIDSYSGGVCGVNLFQIYPITA